MTGFTNSLLIGANFNQMVCQLIPSFFEIFLVIEWAQNRSKQPPERQQQQIFVGVRRIRRAVIVHSRKKAGDEEHTEVVKTYEKSASPSKWVPMILDPRDRAEHGP